MLFEDVNLLQKSCEPVKNLLSEDYHGTNKKTTHLEEDSTFGVFKFNFQSRIPLPPNARPVRSLLFELFPIRTLPEPK
jgi:hypothetical protein